MTYGIEFFRLIVFYGTVQNKCFSSEDYLFKYEEFHNYLRICLNLLKTFQRKIK